MRYRFILAEKALYPVTLLCRTLAVSTSGFYDWCRREESRRQRDDAWLKLNIAAIHKRSRETYGSPRVQAELRSHGQHVSRKRVARLMREAGLEGRPRRKWTRTTDSAHSQPVAANLLDRQFSVTAPNRAWAADITYVRTWEGWLYLAVILDLYSRRVVGFKLDESLEKQLVLQAIDMALGLRQPDAGLLHHSDRGSQYASDAYQEVLTKRGLTCSMSRRGDCWDNAVVESFFGTLKTELLHRRAWPTRQSAHLAISEYLSYYNAHRLHSSLGYRSPMQFEAQTTQELRLAA